MPDLEAHRTQSPNFAEMTAAFDSAEELGLTSYFALPVGTVCLERAFQEVDDDAVAPPTIDDFKDLAEEVEREGALREKLNACGIGCDGKISLRGVERTREFQHARNARIRKAREVHNQRPDTSKNSTHSVQDALTRVIEDAAFQLEVGDDFDHWMMKEHRRYGDDKTDPTQRWLEHLDDVWEEVHRTTPARLERTRVETLWGSRHANGYGVRTTKEQAVSADKTLAWHSRNFKGGQFKPQDK